MSDEVKDTDLNLDLHFLPSWAQQSPEINRFADYEGESARRGPRGKGPRNRGPGRPDDRRGPRRDRPPGGGRPPKGGKPFGKGPRRHGGAPRPPQRPPAPLPELEATIVPDEKGVDSLTRQIRITGRAYPLFEIAGLILQKADRYLVELQVKKKQDGSVLQPLWLCALDDTLWLNEEEATRYILDRHLGTFYQVEKTPTDPPKGTYTFVAQCGMSGVILGPPNYHDYQTKLHKLHSERFSKMPFEKFKSRVKIVKDEEVVKQWIEDQSFRTEYIVLNVPEPLRIESWDGVVDHFKSNHLPNIVKQIDAHQVAGENARHVGSKQLQRLVNHVIDDQRRFPLKVVNRLSSQFASRGLQFFKVNKTVTHVSVSRPHYLDVETTVVSHTVRRILEHINGHPRCTVKDLVEALAPAPKSTETPPAPTEPTAEAAEPGTSQPEAATDSKQEKKPHHEPTEEQKQILAELHWLVHQGHVIEFANGELESAKKPNARPQQKQKPKKDKSAAGQTGDSAQSTTTADPNPASSQGPSATDEKPSQNAPASKPASVETEKGGNADAPSTEPKESTSMTADPGRILAEHQALVQSGTPEKASNSNQDSSDGGSQSGSQDPQSKQPDPSRDSETKSPGA